MKILAIRCKNLASLEGEQVVDFTAQPLSDAGLFAIVGPTGSGKSTLLDALCLALYNKTPRTKQRGVDSREILRRGTGEGYAEVEFVSLNGNRYRSKWSVNRARNAPDGKLQNVSVELQDMTNGQLFGETPGRTFDIIEKLIGLSFDQFNRAVLLAQGEFSAFLEADENKKAEILEKLTGTGLYAAISSQIFERNKKEKEKLDQLKWQLGSIVLMTEDEKNQKKETVEQRKSAKKEIAQTIEQLDGSVQWLKTLEKILSDIQTAEQDLGAVAQQKKDREGDEQWLAQWDKAQEITISVHQQQEAQAQALSFGAELQTLTAQEYNYQKDIQTAEENRDRIEKNLVHCTAQKNEARPRLNDARAMDEQIKSLEEREKTARQDSETAQRGVAIARAELEGQVALRDRQTKEKEALRVWLDGNKELESLSQNIGLVENLLGQAKDAADLAARAENEHAQKVVAKTDAGLQLLELEKKRGEAESLLTDLKGQDEHLGKEWESLEKDRLIVQKQHLEERFRQLQTAQLLFSEQAHAETELLNLQQRRSAAETELQQEQGALAKNRQQLAVMDEVLAIARESLERSRLLVAENVESLRAALLPGDPCSVCGSTEHPFAQTHPVHEALLGEQVETVKAHEQTRGQFQSDCAQNEARSEMLLAELASISQRMPQVEEIFQEKNRAWIKSPIASEWNLLSEPQKPGWLEGQQESVRTELDATVEKLARCTQLEDNRSRIGQQLQAISQDLTELKGRTDLSKQAIKTADEAIGTALLAIEHARSRYGELIRSLAAHFSEPDWENEWKKQPAVFIRQKQQLADEWKGKNERFQTIFQELIGLDASISERQRRMLELQEDEKLKSDHLDKVSQQLTLHKNQRNQIFEGRSADQVEMELDTAVNTAQDSLNGAQKLLDDLKIKLNQVDTRRVAIQEQQLRLQQQIENSSGEINTWIQKQSSYTNWTFDLLKEVLSRPAEKIQSIRGELNMLNNRLEQCRAVLGVHRQKMDLHRNVPMPAHSLEELEEELRKKKNDLEACTTEISAIEADFLEDAKKRRQAEDQLKGIAVQDAIADNWAKLNQDLGSSDGDKFRKIAQGYALDILLGHANIHLGQFAKRYSLQRVSGNLLLNVVDHHMAYEVRSVSSLSGGETFLVSLALALGLSSLSSDQIRVESLFIDEGFGSLDPETLATAMDALEALQNQGRKIGVISHVQEMTEKIQVQVRVRKVSKGKSRVEVVTAY